MLGRACVQYQSYLTPPPGLKDCKDCQFKATFENISPSIPHRISQSLKTICTTVNCWVNEINIQGIVKIYYWQHTDIYLYSVNTMQRGVRLGLSQGFRSKIMFSLAFWNYFYLFLRTLH